MSKAIDFLREHSELIAAVLLLLLAAGAVAHCERVADAREDVAQMQGTIDELRRERRADSLRADSLEEEVEQDSARIARLDSSLAEARQTTERVRRRTERRVDSLQEAFEESIASAVAADSSFRALGDSLAEAVRPQLEPLVRERSRLHLQTVQHGRDALASLRATVDSKNTYIGRLETEVDTLRTAYKDLRADYDTVRTAWRQEQELNASLRRELKLTRSQVDRLQGALNTSVFGDVLRSPVSHALAAGAGFAAGVASN